MRTILIIFFTAVFIQSHGQSFLTYKDTVNRFSINIPVGWRYGINKNMPQIQLMAYRTPSSPTDTSRDNFNINIIATPGKTLDKSFSDFLVYLPSDTKNFAFIDKDDTTINGIKFKWVIETHKNENLDLQMHNYDFLAVRYGRTYILTMVTFSRTFDAVKPLFDKIAGSFALLD